MVTWMPSSLLTLFAKDSRPNSPTRSRVGTGDHAMKSAAVAVSCCARHRLAFHPIMDAWISRSLFHLPVIPHRHVCDIPLPSNGVVVGRVNVVSKEIEQLV